MYRTYAEAFAAHYPRYTAYYATKGREACEAARHDIYETLAAVSQNLRNDDPYVGKLYAELDAVRDRLMRLDQLDRWVADQSAEQAANGARNAQAAGPFPIAGGAA